MTINEFYQSKTAYKKINAKKNNPVCVACGKIGGTLFDTNLVKDARILSISCAANNNKCKYFTTMVIKVPTEKNMQESVMQLQNSLSSIEAQIIKTKMNAIFEYIVKEDIDSLFSNQRHSYKTTGRLLNTSLNNIKTTSELIEQNKVVLNNRIKESRIQLKNFLKDDNIIDAVNEQAIILDYLKQLRI
jgi:hypothetical protein